ncbi:AcrB/AcrD/AcrF family protein [Halomonas sp. ZH2S]|uniref:AcrB/AcrD/AcrF family protein n=1 Tax=Vreelandella zhuhanensis TaxID=2684210 RepID=A0A7X3GY69_9GAMM|nr:efflux RND transporter permease subunit [Halomonas zhuhanensis]MWJ26899.1 AcrB/AcrD/AcrF family protein [Halomonas zhuhanensis]
MNESSTRMSPLEWAARHPVFANLVMGLLLIGGLFFVFDVQQSVFPDIEPNQVIITVPYAGAAPEEVEQGVVLAIEEEVRGIEGVERVLSTAAEGRATVVAELFTSADRDRARTDIDAAVARIVTFPAGAEDPVIQVPDPRVQVVSLMVSAPLSPDTLHRLGEQLREALLRDPDISRVEIGGLQPPEISVEVPQANLRRYNLSLPQIAGLIDQASIDLPSGEIQDSGGDILLRITEQRDRTQQFATIPVVSLADGTQVRLGDIATIREDFSTDKLEAFLDGQPAIRLNVFRVGQQTPMDVSTAVHAVIAQQRQLLPEQVQLLSWDDNSEIYADRMGLLVRNGLIGLGLVLVLLGLFLMPRLAFWVTVGMAVSFLGAFAFMPLLDVSLNMISLFAFLLALGIVVDDAIVVGEAAFSHRNRGLGSLDAAIAGVHEMAKPVTFAVTTTVIAFLPLLFVPGTSGDFFRNIPLIVIPILLLSLFESFFVLPAHIGHSRQTADNRLSRLQQRFTQALERFIAERYTPFLRLAIQWRYLTLALGLAVLLVVAAIVASERISFTFMPEIEGDKVTVSLEFPFGTPAVQTRAAIERLMTSAQEVDEELGNISQGIFAQLGRRSEENAMDAGEGVEGAHVAYVQVFLVKAGRREVGAGDFAERWREQLGELAGVRTLRFSTDVGPSSGEAIAIELAHQDRERLEEAARGLAAELEQYRGVIEIDDDVELGKRQLDLRLSPAGYAQGLMPQDLAQVRGAFFGAEPQRQQRGRHELRIFVRLPEEDRGTRHSMETLLIQLADGGEMPLEQAAIIEQSRSPRSITRTDGRRTLTVTADVQAGVITPNEVIADLEAQVLPGLLNKLPGLDYRLAGELRDQQDALQALGRGMLLALLAMYALMAIAFRSYVEPLLVMFAIPFGVVGAVIGHLLMGYNLSLISLMGLVALAGVVVNGTLVYILAVDNLRQEGRGVGDAIVAGGARRFRPILITSLTTFFGLAPMIFETSLQARFLIPMAISLGFGVLFVTLIVLVLVPAVYRIIEDARQLRKAD